MRSLERRDTGQSYQDFLSDLDKAQGIDNPTKEDCARLDRKRKNKASNQDWVNPHDRDALLAKMAALLPLSLIGFARLGTRFHLWLSARLRRNLVQTFDW